LIDKENEVFGAVATALRKHFKGIYVIGAEMSSAPPKFPAVSFVQTNSAVKTEHSTFDSLENVVTEDYKAEVYSNLEKGKEAQTKEITSIISDVMSTLGYGRTFCEVVPNVDATINRRMSRYRKNNVI
jgi:restriction endonuclease Mrr